MQIYELRPGDRFRVKSYGELELLKLTPCRALVRPTTRVDREVTTWSSPASLQRFVEDGHREPMMRLVDLLNSPEELERAQPRECADLLGELVRLETLVRLRLDSATKPMAPENGNDEVFLLPEEAAELARVDVKWLIRNTRRLPFRRQPSRKQIRFERRGFLDWMKARR